MISLANEQKVIAREGWIFLATSGAFFVLAMIVPLLFRIELLAAFDYHALRAPGPSVLHACALDTVQAPKPFMSVPPNP